MMPLDLQPGLSAETAADLAGRWDDGGLRVGDEIRLGGERYAVTGFDPVSVQARRLYLLNLETGLACRLTVPDRR